MRSLRISNQARLSRCSRIVDLETAEPGSILSSGLRPAKTDDYDGMLRRGRRLVAISVLASPPDRRSSALGFVRVRLLSGVERHPEADHLNREA